MFNNNNKCIREWLRKKKPWRKTVIKVKETKKKGKNQPEAFLFS